ncbi:unnamed protein product [Bursaphelenchus xylophilus]|uniref:(pine wood nematode) hypothetical protein n=1 Tax=Bursaphelenchus xylophilus TaxID=6326 RepID=A0A1I7RS57_BURXY|nr:unnamed protein product [Bursaphelenchus xylophilus]CAG9123193.1 unnamed protein product [Bursaphelenchus xylophilus]
MNSVLICFLLVSVIFACQPDPGNHGPLSDYEITTNPIFGFKYSPPVQWTWSLTPLEGQEPSEEAALTLIRNTVREKFTEAVKKETLFPPTNLNITTDLVHPQEVLIVTDPAAELTDGQGRVQLGVVATICKGNETCTEQPLIIEDHLYLFNGPLLNGRQWRNVANYLWADLQVHNGVLFRAPITVTK